MMYIENYSVLLDIKLILMTVKILFMKESTEGFTDEKSSDMTRIGLEGEKERIEEQTEEQGKKDDGI